MEAKGSSNMSGIDEDTGMAMNIHYNNGKSTAADMDQVAMMEAAVSEALSLGPTNTNKTTDSYIDHTSNVARAIQKFDTNTMDDSLHSTPSSPNKNNTMLTSSSTEHNSLRVGGVDEDGNDVKNPTPVPATTTATTTTTTTDPKTSAIQTNINTGSTDRSEPLLDHLSSPQQPEQPAPTKKNSLFSSIIKSANTTTTTTTNINNNSHLKLTAEQLRLIAEPDAQQQKLLNSKKLQAAQPPQSSSSNNNSNNNTNAKPSTKKLIPLGEWFEHQKQHTQENWKKVVNTYQQHHHQQQQQQQNNKNLTSSKTSTNNNNNQNKIKNDQNKIKNDQNNNSNEKKYKKDGIKLGSITKTINSNLDNEVGPSSSLSTNTSASDNIIDVAVKNDPSEQTNIPMKHDSSSSKPKSTTPPPFPAATLTNTTLTKSLTPTNDDAVAVPVTPTGSPTVKTTSATMNSSENISSSPPDLTVLQAPSNDDEIHTVYSNNSNKDGPNNNVILEAVVFKRRSGLGKLSVKYAWEKRKVTLAHQTILSYFSLPDPTTNINSNNDNINNDTTNNKDSSSAVSASSSVATPTAAASTNSATTNPKQGLKWSWEEARLNLEKATENLAQQLLNNPQISNLVKHHHNNDTTATGTSFDAVNANGDLDPTIARGTMDLIKDDVSVFASYGHAGAPTPFSITIMSNASSSTNLLSKTAVANYDNSKWILAFDTQREQMAWLTTLTDIVVQQSVNSYNEHLIKYYTTHNTTTTTTNTTNPNLDTTTTAAASSALATSVGSTDNNTAKDSSTISSLSSPSITAQVVSSVEQNNTTSNHNYQRRIFEEQKKPIELKDSYLGTTTGIYYPAPDHHQKQQKQDTYPADDSIGYNPFHGVRLWRADGYFVKKEGEVDNNPNQQTHQKHEESNDHSDDDYNYEDFEDTENDDVLLNSSPSIRSFILSNVFKTAISGKYANYSISGNNLFRVWGFFHILLLTSNKYDYRTNDIFWYVWVFIHAAIWLCIVHTDNIYVVSQQHRKDARISREKYESKIINDSKKEKKSGAISTNKHFDTLQKNANEKKNADKPVAGTTCVELAKNGGSDVVNGHTFQKWDKMQSSEFKVRSHGYLTNGRMKIESPSELYDVAHVDLFSSKQRVADLCSKMQLPNVSFQDKSAKNWHSPDIFVVSLAVPTEAPKLGRSADDGKGVTITIYYKMKQSTRDILRRITADDYDSSTDSSEQDVDPQRRIVAAVKLFEEYCRRAPNDPSFQARFKLIPNCHNIKEVGLPGWISKYCGKPVLIKRKDVTGFLIKSPELNVMEFDISLHPFPYLAKQAMSYLHDNMFKKILFSVAYVIEGRSDEELPEVLIGNPVKIYYPNPDIAIDAEDFFAGTSPLSFDISEENNKPSLHGNIAKIGNDQIGCVMVD